jgi:hypothetical protein
MTYLGDMSSIDLPLARAMIKLLKAHIAPEVEDLPVGAVTFVQFHEAMVTSLPGFYSPTEISFSDLKRTALVLAAALKTQEDLHAFSWWVSRQEWLAKDASLMRTVNALSRSIVHVKREFRAFIEQGGQIEQFCQQADDIARSKPYQPPIAENMSLFQPNMLVSRNG